ncbi:hypothetical protein A2U01_0103060, partial [Trifolium medium]|nr:hypothetical protein [Trifolium medium]
MLSGNRYWETEEACASR